jgi:signal transduction histidine kinase
MDAEAIVAEYNALVQRVRRVRHDASNPLTAALGSVQLLQTDPAITDPEVQTILGEVEHELRRLNLILQSLSDIRER